jgi:hypothetical protein
MLSIVNKTKLYSEFKEKFRAELLKEIDDRKPLSIKNLDFAFIGIDGKKYYHFINHLDLPLERFAVKKTLLSWMALSLDVKEFDQLIEVAKLSLNEGLKTGKSAAKIGFILTQMEDRRKMVVHTDLLYQFIAVHYIREDENADGYSDLIQMEKVEQFKKEVEAKGSGFFLGKRELKSLYDMTDWSPSEWATYWQESLIQQKALKIQLDSMESELVSE